MQQINMHTILHVCTFMCVTVYIFIYTLSVKNGTPRAIWDRFVKSKLFNTKVCGFEVQPISP